MATKRDFDPHVAAGTLRSTRFDAENARRSVCAVALKAVCRMWELRGNGMKLRMPERGIRSKLKEETKMNVKDAWKTQTECPI